MFSAEVVNCGTAAHAALAYRAAVKNHCLATAAMQAAIGSASDVQTLGELVDSGKGWPRGPGVNAWVRQFFLKAIRNGLHAAKLAQQAGVTHMGVIQVWDLKDSGLTRARANWPFMQYILAGFQALDNFPESTARRHQCVKLVSQLALKFQILRICRSRN